MGLLEATVGHSHRIIQFSKSSAHTSETIWQLETVEVRATVGGIHSFRAINAINSAGMGLAWTLSKAGNIGRIMWPISI